MILFRFYCNKKDFLNTKQISSSVILEPSVTENKNQHDYLVNMIRIIVKKFFHIFSEEKYEKCPRKSKTSDLFTHKMNNLHYLLFLLEDLREEIKGFCENGCACEKNFFEAEFISTS